MRNTLGSSVTLSLWGESHGECIGAVLDGFAPGVKVDKEFIDSWMAKRRPSSATDTARRESDPWRIVSGVRDGFTTGAPISIIIPNENVRSADYERSLCIPRPSHADYAAHVKYAGFEDFRGGGHFSGRITASIVALGALALKTLNDKGIQIGTHILSCAGASDSPFEGDIASQIALVNSKDFPVIAGVEEKMSEGILQARAEGDSVGGVIQTAVTGLEAGVGEPWFDSLEGALSRAIFALGGVKGIEFGSGFALAGMRGSSANDPFGIVDGKVVTLSNNNGGINGGISNGMPVVFNCAVKPTPSIAKPQRSVDLGTGCETTLEIKGRHDPAIVRRICPVVTCLSAIVLCDQLALRHGTNFLSCK